MYSCHPNASNEIYRGKKVTVVSVVRGAGIDVGNHTYQSYIEFDSLPKNTSSIKAKVNGVAYEFKYYASKGKWYCYGYIFSNVGTYTIEFLN